MTGPLMIHGLVEADAPAPLGAPCHRRVAGPARSQLAALVSPIRLGPDGAADAAEALRHHDILAAYAAVTDVAPVRFGAVAADEAGVAALLAARAEAHAAALDRVAGCLEFADRLTPMAAETAAAVDQPAGGRTYLQSRLAERQRREAAALVQAALVARVSGALADHACEAFAVPPRPARGQEPPRLLDLALVVPRRGVADLAAEAEALAAEAAAAGLVLLLKGPWPAYSFVAEDRAEDAA